MLIDSAKVVDGVVIYDDTYIRNDDRATMVAFRHWFDEKWTIRYINEEHYDLLRERLPRKVSRNDELQRLTRVGKIDAPDSTSLFAYVWLRRFGYSAPEPVGLQPDQLDLLDKIKAHPVHEWPSGPISWRWQPRRDKLVAVGGERRTRRPIWWRRRTPLEAYWDLREAITGRWRPGPSERTYIPQIEGRKPTKAPTDLVPRPFQRRKLDSATERIDRLVDLVGNVAADHQRQKHQVQQEVILENGACPSWLFISARPGQARIGYRPLWAVALRCDMVALEPWLMAEAREERPYTDLSDSTDQFDESPFWSSEKLEPKGCRQLVWFKTPKKGPPPSPTGKEFKPISSGAEHIRKVIDKINSDKRTSLVCGVQFIPKLTRQEERDLVRSYIDTGDIVLRRNLVDANLRVASIHAKKRAGFKDSYNDLLGPGVKAMLEALEDRKFDPSRGTRLSTFFEYVVNGDVIDHLIKENLYSSRHALCSFLDDHDDTPMDGEPVEKAAAVQLAVEAKIAEEWVGEDNMVDQLEEIEYCVAGIEDAIDRWIINGRFYRNRTAKEIGSELGLSDGTVTRRETKALAEMKLKFA